VEDHHDAPLSTAVEAPTLPGTVTLMRSDFDTLCQKLSRLEESIADLQREVRSTQQSNAVTSPGTGGRPTRERSPDDDVDPRRQSHTDRHGLHTKNESASHCRVKPDVATCRFTD
jgi:hypothetical protein